MSGGDSSRWLLERFRDGEDNAATALFDRYVDRLIGLVRRRMSPGLQRRVDPEDVVQSALRSFFIRAVREEYVLQRAGDLWRLLAAITLSKLRRQVEVHTSAKRALAKEHATDADDADLAAIVARGPTPDEEAALLEEVNQVLDGCRPDEREALVKRMAGETVAEIAESMGRSQRTIRRLLQASRESLQRRLLIDEDAEA